MKSIPPRRTPKVTDIPMTSNVRFRAVSRSGQMTFLISDVVSRLIRRAPENLSELASPRFGLLDSVARALDSRRASPSARLVVSGVATAVSDSGVTRSALARTVVDRRRRLEPRAAARFADDLRFGAV